MLIKTKIKINAVRREGVGRFTFKMLKVLNIKI
jgi:hypothetical protein